MAQLPDPSLRSIFQPDDGPVRALVVAGACGNVGFGKLGQFARLLTKHHIPVVALDLSSDVQAVKEKLREAYGTRFKPEQVDAILDGIHVVEGGVDDISSDLKIGFVFEAIPERLDIKHPFYAAVRNRDPEAFIFSATSGFPSTMLFEGLPGSERCGVMHPFFPHLTNKLWEVPLFGAVTGKDEAKAIRKFLGGLGMNLIGVKDVPSFAADRLFCGMMLEAVRIHAELGVTPAQIDDVCKKTLGTSPFFVHNLIPGANYLSAHCMELMTREVDSNLFSIPTAWKPYLDDPKKQWPYERGQKCPPDKFDAVRDRMLGMLISLTAYMIEHEIAKIDAINYLSENALAFREGMPALIQRIGFDTARDIAKRFLSTQKISKANEVAPLGALSEGTNGWWSCYVHTSVHDGIGLLSLKRMAISDTFIAELDHAYERLAVNDDVRAIVIAPDGVYSREFGHGADLQAFVPVLGKEDKALDLIQRWKRTLGKLRMGNKPTVAALVGRVLGGGLEMAMSCHARIGGARTRLAFPETTVGVVPGLGGCHNLHRSSHAEHWPRINHALLTGHGFSVDDANAWGLVSDVVPIPDLPAASMKLAAALAADPTKIPSFREQPADVEVNTDVPITNEGGVVLDADLRALLVETIKGANALPFADGSRLEEKNAAKSLAMSSSAIGIKAMMRGKPPGFERPLGG